jgi:hypothetical protein
MREVTMTTLRAHGNRLVALLLTTGLCPTGV